MREEDSNWFARWEEELPTPDELMPLSQTLITPDLALAFDIPNQHPETSPPPPLPPSSHPSSTEFDSCGVELGSPGTAGDGPARTLKRPRLVWTPQLHKRFVDAVAHLGIKNAVPKTIMQLMSVDGLTRENVASHLQKYRLYLKRVQDAGGVGGLSSAAASSDPATDHLFASSPVPPHFLHPGRNADHFMPFVPVAAQHQLQMAAAAAAAVPRPQLLQQQEQQQYHHNRQVGHLPPLGGQFEHPFQMTSSHQAHMVGLPVHHSMHASYVDDLELTSAATGGGRKVLTLFPVGDD